MTLATPSLVFCKVSIVYTSILILLTLPLLTQQAATSTTLLVIRVLHLMTQVCSIAPTFLFRWFVQLARTPSSPRLALRPATAWSQTHSLKEPPLAQVASELTATATTEELQLRTSCDSYSQPSRPPSGGLFLLWG